MADTGLLNERVALVAGIGPDLGGAIARALAREGARLVLVDERAEAVQAAAQALRNQGSEAQTVIADLREREDCRHVVKTALDAFGRIDALVVDVASEAPHTAFAEADLASWRRSFDLDVFGPLQLVQESIPSMRAEGAGSIVLIGAPELRLSDERSGALCAAHGALWMASRTLARELGPEGIRINTVIPGPLERREAAYALGRPAEPDAVADAVVFFASDLSCIVTGQSLDVNCGSYFH